MRRKRTEEGEDLREKRKERIEEGRREGKEEEEKEEKEPQTAVGHCYVSPEATWQDSSAEGSSQS